MAKKLKKKNNEWVDIENEDKPFRGKVTKDLEKGDKVLEEKNGKKFQIEVQEKQEFDGITILRVWESLVEEEAVIIE